MKASNLRVYLVCGTQDCDHNTEKYLTMVEKALQSGITMFQFREKGQGTKAGEAKLTLAKQVQALCKTYNVPFIVNDDVPLAVKINADGVHIGQDDEPPAKVRQAIGPNKILGLSVHDPTEYAKSDLTSVDYIGVGPVYPTGSKSDAKESIGCGGIIAVRNVAGTLPIVAIGGITTENAHEVIQAGADGVAIISAITKAKDTTKAVKDLTALY